MKDERTRLNVQIAAMDDNRSLQELATADVRELNGERSWNIITGSERSRRSGARDEAGSI